MIRRLPILFCFGLLLTWACNQSPEIQPSNYSISNAQKYLSAYNSGKLAHQQAQFYTGEVYIRSASENRLAIYLVDRRDQEQEVFILQMLDNKRKDFELKIEQGQLFYFRNQLIINATDRNLKLKFGLIDSELLAIEKEEELSFEYTFLGYGLAQLKGYAYYNPEKPSSRNAGLGEPGDPPTEEKPSCSCTNNILTECDSGGQGSSSCSVTNTNGQSCSTSCSSATQWACCNHNE